MESTEKNSAEESSNISSPSEVDPYRVGKSYAEILNDVNDLMELEGASEIMTDEEILKEMEEDYLKPEEEQPDSRQHGQLDYESIVAKMQDIRKQLSLIACSSNNNPLSNEKTGNSHPSEEETENISPFEEKMNSSLPSKEKEYDIYKRIEEETRRAAARVNEKPIYRSKTYIEIINDVNDLMESEGVNDIMTDEEILKEMEEEYLTSEKNQSACQSSEETDKAMPEQGTVKADVKETTDVDVSRLLELRSSVWGNLGLGIYRKKEVKKEEYGLYKRYKRVYKYNWYKYKIMYKNKW